MVGPMTQQSIFDLVQESQVQVQSQRKRELVEATRGATMAFESQDITYAKHHGNEFSREANKSLKATKAELRTKVLAYIRSCGLTGATAEECEDYLKLGRSTVSARFTELKALDQIKLVSRRKTKSGRSAGVWKAN